MSSKEDDGEGSALDAIEAIANEGLNRSKSGRRNIYLRTFLGATFLVGVIIYYSFNRLAELAPVPVALMVPDSNSAVADNAARQMKGFREAHDERYTRSEPNIHRFPYPLKVDDVDAVMAQIDQWYDKGIRIFIMTMSGALNKIAPEFDAWAANKRDDDKPVLVATVASAPDIAQSEKGIFRHYIRSQDESDILSTYIDVRPRSEVNVIYVDDEYGRKAEGIFRARHLLVMNKSQPIKLGDDEIKIKEKIALFMDEIVNSKGAVVVVVGYGSMVKNVLLALHDGVEQDQNFKGTMLIVSTFTESAWRPTKALNDDLDFAERIRTVGPALERNAARRGVVYQFSFMTMQRALNCDSSEAWHARRGLKEFTECWSNYEPSGIAKGWGDSIELTADGDSHVSLRLLDHTTW